MKRLFIDAILILILFTSIGIIYYSQNDSQLFVANIDALAQVEHGQYIKCYNNIKSDPMDTVIYCAVCDEIPGTWKSSMDFCIP
jgi:hypothetical protein